MRFISLIYWLIACVALQCAARPHPDPLEGEVYEPAIPARIWSGNRPAPSKAFSDATTSGTSLFYAVAMEATVMSLEPRNFLKWRAGDYVDRIASYINETTGNVVSTYLASVHGEDGGTGAVTTVIFLTGGIKAAQNFRDGVLKQWDEVQKMLPASPFGQGCHMEGYSWPCVVDEDGLRPNKKQIEKYNLKPTLQIWVALINIRPEDVTKEIQERVNFYVAEALRPAKSVVSSDWFIDDNLEAPKYAAKMKPVFNINAESPSVQALEKLQRQIRLIMAGDESSYTIWPKSSGLGKVHIEGETDNHPHICYRGSIPNTIQKYEDRPRAPPSPPPTPTRAILTCEVRSATAYSPTEGIVDILAEYGTDSCDMRISSADGTVQEQSVPSMSYPVTSVPISGLSANQTYMAEVNCQKDGAVARCIPVGTKFMTPPSESVPTIATVTQRPPVGGNTTVISVIPPRTEPLDGNEENCTAYSLIVKDKSGQVLTTIQTTDFQATLADLYPGKTYTLIPEAQCGGTVITGPSTEYTPSKARQDSQTQPPASPSPPPPDSTALPPDVIPSPPTNIDPIIDTNLIGEGTCRPLLAIKTSGFMVDDVGNVLVSCGEQTYPMGTFTPGILGDASIAYVPLHWSSTSPAVDCEARVVIGESSATTTFSIPQDCQPSGGVIPKECYGNGVGFACDVDLRPTKCKDGSDPLGYSIEVRDRGTGKILMTINTRPNDLHDIKLPNLSPEVQVELIQRTKCEGDGTTPPETLTPFLTGKETIGEAPPPPMPISPPTPIPPPSVVPNEPMACEMSQFNAYATGEHRALIEFEPDSRMALYNFSCVIKLLDQTTGVAKFDETFTKDELSGFNFWTVYGLNASTEYEAEANCSSEDSACMFGMSFRTPGQSQIYMNNIHPGVSACDSLFGGNVRSNCTDVIVTIIDPVTGREVARQELNTNTENGSQFIIQYEDPRTSFNQTLCAYAEGVNCPGWTKSECYHVPFSSCPTQSSPPPSNVTTPSPPPSNVTTPSPPPSNVTTPSPPPSPPTLPEQYPDVRFETGLSSQCDPSVKVTVNDQIDQDGGLVVNLVETCDGKVTRTNEIPMQTSELVVYLNQTAGQQCEIAVFVEDPNRPERLGGNMTFINEVPSNCVESPTFTLEKCITDSSVRGGSSTCKIGDITPPFACRPTNMTLTVTPKEGVTAYIPPPIELPLVDGVPQVNAMDITNLTPGIQYIFTMTTECFNETLGVVFPLAQSESGETPPYKPPPPPPPPPPSPPATPRDLTMAQFCMNAASLLSQYGQEWNMPTMELPHGCRYEGRSGCCHCPQCHQRGSGPKSCPWASCGKGNGSCNPSRGSCPGYW